MDRNSYIVLPVSASAYPNNDPRGFLTHAISIETDKPVCNRVKSASILDDAELATESPTCPHCLRIVNA